MPRLTGNSRETAASNDTGSASPSGRETAPATSSSSHVSAVPSSRFESVNAGNLVNDVVQALQGTLAGLVQSAIGARLLPCQQSAPPSRITYVSLLWPVQLTSPRMPFLLRAIWRRRPADI